MPIAFDRKLGAATGTGNSLALNITASAGEYVVLWVACDNTDGTNAPGLTSITGETHSERAAHGATSFTGGAATRGFIIIIPSLATSYSAEDLVINFTPPGGDTVGKSAVIGAVFTGASNTVIGTAGVSTGSDFTAISQASSGNVTGEGLGLAIATAEDNTAITGWSGGTSLVEPGGDGDVFTTGGGAAANLVMLAGYRINTYAGGTQTALATGGPTRDGGYAVVVMGATPTGRPRMYTPNSAAYQRASRW